MAAAGCAPVKFFCTSESAFYFEDLAATDVDQDAFSISTYPAEQFLIRCKDNKFLILTVENIEVQNLTIEQQSQSEYKFNIQFYKYNNTKGGRAVMLYANKAPTKDSKKIVVCCNENHEIQPEEMMDLPQQIEESGHKAVFYRTKLATSNYLLESSLYPTEFLGLEPNEENLSKLVLCHKREDEVDEYCEFGFSQ